jgi:ParB-like chromosome segregation protein Spo0J
LRPDLKNARKRTERSYGLIKNSLEEFGAARSIVIDETGTVLAGNGTVEAAADAGIERVLVVPADGNTLVAVQRTDLSDRQKRRYAIADNRASDLSEWDASTLSELVEEDPDLHLDSFFTEEELDGLMADLATEEGQGDEEKGKSQGKLEVKLTFEDVSDFDTFLQTLQQLSAALPKLRTTEQRLQFILDQYLSSV